jgi:hypothetical protein
MSGTPRRGETLSHTLCGYEPEMDGVICGRVAVYEIDFGDGERSLACAEHAALARAEFDIKAMWSL